MKALYLIFLLLLTVCVSRSVGVAAEQQPSAHKPCVDHLNAVPASEEDTATFNQILHSVPSDRTILLYVSHDQIIRNYGGAMSLHCEVASQEIYDTYEDWTVYDPDLIQGDAARDFVFAHEIAHHMNGDTTSAMRNSVDVELRADLDGARYLQRLGWSEARLMHALDLLNLPQSQQKGYPTSNRRRENIREAFAPPQIGAPTGLTGRAVAENPSLAERIDNLLQYGGPLRFESARTGKLVCAIGTADRRIPTLENFEFFDNCEDSKFTRFQLLRNADKSQLWITQQADPCPDYAVNCLYVLKSTGSQLGYWNSDLAADQSGWEGELGKQEQLKLEVYDAANGVVRIVDPDGHYVVADKVTGHLTIGGGRAQAAQFRVLLDVDN